MPRYFFDIDDGVQATTDSLGSLFDNDHVRDEAIGTLVSVARDVLPDGDHHRLEVSVRDADGDVVYRATLTLESGRLASKIDRR